MSKITEAWDVLRTQLEELTLHDEVATDFINGVVEATGVKPTSEMTTDLNSLLHAYPVNAQ
jgi:hypothetical protein